MSNKAQDIWHVIWVARNPFNTRKNMPTILEGKDIDEDKAQAIIDQHFKGYEEEDAYRIHTMKRVQLEKRDLVTKLLKALSTTCNTSTPGPDRISYCLLKLIKDTNLGLQTMNFLADFLRWKRTILSGKGDGRDITVVMIPKTGKDLSRVKGWRPIVFINCLIKLMDKVVANELQNLPVFHHGQYRSRKGKSVMDMAIQATTEAQTEKAKGRGCAWALGDIKSAFNYTQKENLLKKLRGLERCRSLIEGIMSGVPRL